jgi:L-asparagine transporter-like permease
VPTVCKSGTLNLLAHSGPAQTCTGKVETKLIPVISGATETISKSLGQYLNNVPGKQQFKEMEKTALLGTANGLREVLR